MTTNNATNSPIFSATTPVTISSGQCNALHTTPIQVVAAQGSGVLIVPIIFIVEVQNGSTQFGSMGNVFFQYGTTYSAVNTASNLIFSTAVVTFAASTKYMYSIPGEIGSDIAGGVWFPNQLPVVGNLTNQPISIASTTNGSGNGSILVTVYYSLITPN